MPCSQTNWGSYPVPSRISQADLNKLPGLSVSDRRGLYHYGDGGDDDNNYNDNNGSFYHCCSSQAWLRQPILIRTNEASECIHPCEMEAATTAQRG